eukprot:gene38621-52177_t
MAPHELAPTLQCLPPILHMPTQMPAQSCSKGTSHLHEEFNFTEPLLETAGKSLRHSCRSELTRQGISLP